MGDVLRRQREGPSDFGNLIDKQMREGSLVPAGIVIAALESEIVANLNAHKKRFLIDGFPRNTEQASILEDKVRAMQSVLGVNQQEHIAGRPVQSRSLLRLLERNHVEKGPTKSGNVRQGG